MNDYWTLGLDYVSNKIFGSVERKSLNFIFQRILLFFFSIGIISDELNIGGSGLYMNKDSCYKIGQ